MGRDRDIVQRIYRTGKIFTGILVSIWGILAPENMKSQTLVLDLPECIRIASDSSLQALIVKNQWMADFWVYRSYRASRLPSLILNTTPLQYNRNIIKRYDYNDNIEVYRAQQSLFTAGGVTLAQNVNWTGGTFFVESDINYIRNYGENRYAQFSTIPFRVGYSQALFGFNDLKWNGRIEPLKYERAKKQVSYRMEEIAGMTVLYYFNLISAQAEYEMALENLYSSDTLYAVGKEKERISAIVKADLQTLELGMINAKNTLKNAEVYVKDAMFKLAAFLNLDPHSSFVLKLPDSVVYLNITTQKALEYAKKNNPDHLTFEQEILEAEKEVEKTRRNAFLDASLTASVGFNQVADNFADAYGRPLQQDLVSVSLSLPLVDWGVRKGQKNVARNKYEVTTISVRQKEMQLQQDIILAVQNFSVEQEQLQSNLRALQLAKSAYAGIKNRYIAGIADMNSLTLSLNRRQEAQRNYINSLKLYWQYYYTIRKLTLFDFGGGEQIEVER